METVIPFFSSGVVEVNYESDLRGKHGLFPMVQVYAIDSSGMYYQTVTAVKLQGRPVGKIFVDTGGETTGIIVIK